MKDLSAGLFNRDIPYFTNKQAQNKKADAKHRLLIKSLARITSYLQRSIPEMLVLNA
jgi:hypothetical protein